jgi:hypothetical protein
VKTSNLTYIGDVRPSQETRMDPTVCYRDSFPSLYVNDVRTSQEAQTSTACYGDGLHSFTLLLVFRKLKYEIRYVIKPVIIRDYRRPSSRRCVVTLSLISPSPVYAATLSYLPFLGFRDCLTWSINHGVGQAPRLRDRPWL